MLGGAALFLTALGFTASNAVARNDSPLHPPLMSNRDFKKTVLNIDSTNISHIRAFFLRDIHERPSQVRDVVSSGIKCEIYARPQISTVKTLLNAQRPLEPQPIANDFSLGLHFISNQTVVHTLYLAAPSVPTDSYIAIIDGKAIFLPGKFGNDVLLLIKDHCHY
jgi:hypothetical protein